MAPERTHPPVEQWDYPDPRPLEARVRGAAAELAPEADLEAMALFLSVLRVANGMQQDVETTVHRPSGTTWAAFRILFTILHAGPTSPLELARLFSVSKASISSVVDTLERNGLVRREPSPTDGRSVLIVITARGERVAGELFQRQNRREAEWARALTNRERQTLLRLLAKLMAGRPAPPRQLPDRLPELPAPAARPHRVPR
jgi:DNA-binding MarR family transcriptional regulator